MGVHNGCWNEGLNKEGSFTLMGVHRGSELWTWDTLLFLGILVCSQSGHYPKADLKNCHRPLEDLAKSGCKPDVKYKLFIILSYSWLCIKNQVQKSCNFFPLFLGVWNLPKSQNHLVFEFWIYNFNFWQDFTKKKKPLSGNYLHCHICTSITLIFT